MTVRELLEQILVGQICVAGVDVVEYTDPEVEPSYNIWCESMNEQEVGNITINVSKELFDKLDTDNFQPI